jgi:hypothetical protein
MGGWWVYLATSKVSTTTASSSASLTARIASSVSAESKLKQGHNIRNRHRKEQLVEFDWIKNTKNHECQLGRLTVTGGREEITVQIDSLYLIQS